jgi:hypothetical protein
MQDAGKRCQFRSGEARRRGLTNLEIVTRRCLRMFLLTVILRTHFEALFCCTFNNVFAFAATGF